MHYKMPSLPVSCHSLPLGFQRFSSHSGFVLKRQRRLFICPRRTLYADAKEPTDVKISGVVG